MARRPVVGDRGRAGRRTPDQVGQAAGLIEPIEAVAELLDRIRRTGWSVSERAGRAVVTPPAPARRLQGWQVLVSATVLSAPRVIAACAPVLVETGTSFTFAASSAAVAALTAARASMAEAGRFLVGHPASDALFRKLVARLDEVTAGLVGPVIRAARPYRPGGVVHYRYGPFVAMGRFDLDGEWRPGLVDPDGNLVDDAPAAVFRPPSWAEPPFGATRDHDTYPGATTGHTAASRAPGPRWSVSAMWTVGPDTTGGSTGAAGVTGAAGPAGISGPAGPAELAGVVVGGRYAVTAAVRQANKGGVYRARDLRAGTEVLIKEARPHVAVDAEGRDVRHRLGHEARVLRHLAPLGVTPRPLREFVQDDHRFLVEELLPGRTLDTVVGGGLARGGVSGGDPGAPELPALLDVLSRLTDLVRAVHSAGVVIRDLRPDNVLVLPDGTLRLLDLELAARVTDGPDTGVRCGLGDADPTYHAPEQLGGVVPDVTADLFSLGMVALHLVGRATPAHPAADGLAGRPVEERVAVLLDPARGGRPVPVPLRRLITGLLRTEPTERIGLAEVAALCAAARESVAASAASAGVDPVGPLPRLPEPDWAELVDGLVGHLGEEFAVDRPPAGAATDRRVEPCTVRHGVAGTVAVLARLVAAGRTPAGPVRGGGADAADPARSVEVEPDGGAGRIASVTAHRASRVLDIQLTHLLRHLDDEPHRRPGLYGGFAGTAWALCDAGRLLGRPRLVDRAVELALCLPVAWPDPGLSNGVAGLGAALLRLWRHTYLPDLRDRITAVAGHLLDTRDPGSAMLWTVDGAADSVHAGRRSLGFAHGTAGIGAFLLSVGHRLGRRDLVAAAERCGDTLLDAARYGADGTVHWPDDPGAGAATTGHAAPAGGDAGDRIVGPDGSTPGSFGRHGRADPAGIGGFLCRLYAHTGERRHLDAAVAAAREVMRTRWRSGTGYCPGLAGDGDFLLDLARVTGDNRYVRWAEALGRRLWVLRVHRDGRAVLLDASERRIGTGFGDGAGGQLAFLLRLRHGGDRLFHPDPDPVPVHRAAA